jgi:glycosyltransferase involved in cell wall biosynthesis
MSQPRKPRVCLLTETFYPVVGGGETQARSLVDGLAEKGIDTLVITRRSSPTYPRQEILGGVPIYRIPPAGPAHLKKWGLLLTSGPELWRQRRRYDVLFVSGFRVLGLTAVLIGKMLGKRCVLKADSQGEMSGDFFSPGLAHVGLPAAWLPFRLFIWGRNAVLRRAEAFVAISHQIAEELAASGVSPEKVWHIPNSVDVGRFYPADEETRASLRQRHGLPAGSRVVVYTGRLVSYKGLPLLLRAWKEIQAARDDARLLLVGSGGLDIHNCEEELRQYVADNGLDGSVRFVGSVPDVNDYLRAADIFAFPTEKEGFSVSLIEAMACGLAVVGTNAGGLKDILRDAYNGLVVPANDFDCFVAVLARLLDDAELCRRLGTAARETVEASYTRDVVTQRYICLFSGGQPDD